MKKAIIITFQNLIRDKAVLQANPVASAFQKLTSLLMIYTQLYTFTHLKMRYNNREITVVTRQPILFVREVNHDY